MMARTLALDIGNRRIGVAVSDASKLLARPLLVIDRKVEDAVACVVQLLAEQSADEIVAGLPYHADGKMSAQAQLVQMFVSEVSRATSVAVVFVDERWSTQDAKAIIADLKKKKQPVHDDAIAAAVILQRYLDEKREGARDDDGVDGVESTLE